MQYEPIKKLYKLFKTYINDAERINVSIPFPQINRRIKGLLPLNKKEDATIALIQEKILNYVPFQLIFSRAPSRAYTAAFYWQVTKHYIQVTGLSGTIWIIASKL